MGLEPKVKLGQKVTQTITDTTTLDLSHQDGSILCNNSSAKTITIPPNADVPFPVGTQVLVHTETAYPITIAAGAGVTINSAAYGNSSAVMAEIRATVVLEKTAVNTWLISGEMAKPVEVFIPIDWAEDGASPPEEAEVIASGTGSIRGRNFESDSSEGVIINWRVPNNIYEAGLIKYKVHLAVTNETGPSGEGIVFSLSGFSLGSNDGLNGTYGSEVVSSATSLTASQYDVVETDTSADVTITDLMRDEVTMMLLYRDHDHASDDYAQDVAVTGITLYYYTRY